MYTGPYVDDLVVPRLDVLKEDYDQQLVWCCCQKGIQGVLKIPKAEKNLRGITPI